MRIVTLAVQYKQTQTQNHEADMSTLQHGSLYEDWRQRRQRLSIDAESNQEDLAAQIRVLDFLLKTYKNSSDAAEPARYPVQSDVMFNERAIIINHHLGARRVCGVKSQSEAESRMAILVKRLAPSHDPFLSSSEGPTEEPFDDPFFDSHTKFAVEANQRVADKVGDKFDESDQSHKQPQRVRIPRKRLVAISNCPAWIANERTSTRWRNCCLATRKTYWN